MAQEQLALRRECHRARAPSQESVSDLLLEPPDLGADGGLGEEEALGRAREPAVVHHGHERAQQVGVEGSGIHRIYR